MTRIFHMPDKPQPPVAIGGIGGSGTRLIAEILLSLGYYMGSDLNQENDNLWFTLLFKRRDVLSATRRELAFCLETFLCRMQGMTDFTPDERQALERLAAVDRGEHPPDWLAMRVATLLTPNPAGRALNKWGWKEPNTHVVLDRLAASLPTLRYVHVLRNGLDMAFNSNQNQLAFWGSAFLGLPAVPIDPRHSLKYWCRVHRRVLEIADDMPGRFLFLDYDALCQRPAEGIGRLTRFLGESLDPTTLDNLLALVKPTGSIGRFRAHGVTAFDKQDLAFVASLGFPVT